MSSSSSMVFPKHGMVSMSSFAYLFSELVQYSQSKVSNTGDLERRLEEVGRCVGGSLVELVQSSSSSSASSTYDAKQVTKLASPYLTRHTRLLDVLRYIYTTVWKYLFGKQAQDLQQSNDADDEYMISDDEVYLWMGRYVSVPKDMGTFNCHAFLAGVVRGVLDEAGFDTVRCVVFHGVFVLDREQHMEGNGVSS